MLRPPTAQVLLAARTPAILPLASLLPQHHSPTTLLAVLPMMARVYADVNQSMPRSYWDYDSVNISQSALLFLDPEKIMKEYPTIAHSALAAAKHQKCLNSICKNLANS